tara:strand:+ start:50 stop:814 length:765 start_codon:yes stop_codon:yes gene_type:complete
MDTFDLRQYLNNNPLLQEGLIYEAADEELIKKAVAKALSLSVEDVPDSDPGEVDKPLKEIAISTIVLIASLIPTALELIGGIINATKRKYGLEDSEKLELAKLDKLIAEKKKYIEALDSKQIGVVGSKEEKERVTLEKLQEEREEKFGSVYGNFFKHAGHTLHEVYTSPIQAFLLVSSWTLKRLGKESKLHDGRFRDRLSNVIYAVIMCSIGTVGVLSHLSHLSGVAAVSTAIADGFKAGKSIKEIIEGALTYI